MPSKIKPLNFKDEVKEYEAFEEKTTLNFNQCKHKNVEIVDGWLKCKCGAAWTGYGIQDVYKLLKNQ